MSGFTLIEMLVAIALLAVIAVLSWRGLDATIRGRDDVVASLAQTRMLGRYFSQLQFDMLNLVTPNEVNGPPLRIMPNELVLVRHLGVGGVGAAWLQAVRYQLKGHRLLRSVSRPASSVSQLTDALHHMDDFASVVANDNVRSMSLSVWIEPDGWTSSQTAIVDTYAQFLAQYRVSTLSTQNMPLPRGIRFSITMGSAGERFSRIVPLAQ